VTVPERRLRDLLLALAAPERRADGARAVAEALGASGLLLYVKDPELEVMLPAPGMPKTVVGGARWREFLRRCPQENRIAAEVDLADAGSITAQAVTRDGAALILLGASQTAAMLDELEGEFPLLAALLNAQQALQIERAEAAEAREAAARASTLAQALDVARAASAELNLQLRREHERKDEFLAMLAHELRNPLSPLVNSIEILRRGPAAAEQGVTRQLDLMSRQLRQLTRLVDDLLDVSRVSRGMIDLRRERLALNDVLADAADAARPLIESRSHLLQRNTAGAIGVYVNGDRVRLTQVFVNLLANAAKYTDPGGRISISVVSDQRRVSVVVQDTGVGIPQNMLTRVFEMFTQVPASLGRAQGGLGIGLTLVRRLVELHGGRVSAYSRGEGQGSTFTVSLPQVLGAAVPGPAPAPAPAVVRPTATGARTGARVLVVDDNRDGAETLAAVLEFMGATPRIAHDGEEALRAAREFAPQLVLLDIGLPGMDGYETARRLRELPGQRPRLVALTGYGSEQDKQRALEAGFDEHHVKPLAPDITQDLLARLDAMQPAS
jgi:signal transduction histidine kinase/ActR/RegA family two-component response regulator